MGLHTWPYVTSLSIFPLSKLAVCSNILVFSGFFFSDDLKYLWLETWKFDCSEALGALWYSMFSHMTISGFETFKKYYLKETKYSGFETDL